ncbi:MAG TPA: FAD-dependent oxidoreductase [Gallionellaceae bacterium]|nr:FAD-dependent oxidoreductase [Gallionellaceae bacterium]
MAQQFKHVIVGAGLAGASAVQGIRELDATGSILLIGEEIHLPYDRPPLSKKLWFGTQKMEEIFLHDRAYYDTHGVTLMLDSAVTEIDPDARTIKTADGSRHGYERLLLATGCRPRRMDIPGADLEGICYFRTLDDYLRIRGAAAAGKTATIIGGGFIGSELAAALCAEGVKVTMIFPVRYICDRVFPESLALAVQQHFRDKGITVLHSDKPVSIIRDGAGFITRTEKGESVHADMVIVGVGAVPNDALARGAGLAVGNGIVVNEYLQTSRPEIYAAGDNAWFPYQALGQSMRVEHWDQALNQGMHAGRNMAGAAEPYTYQPYFYSDLFELGYEATGEVDARLETYSDWQKENETGVIYYLREGVVRGVLLCNVWDRLDDARALIREAVRLTPGQLQGRIR